MTGLDVGGTRVVVTGASGVIGHGIAKAFLEQGARVANWDMAQSGPAAELGETHGSRYRYCLVDLTDEEQICQAAEDTAEAFGGVDVLVNNAGIIAKQEVPALEAPVLDQMYRINIRGVLLAAKHLVPLLKESGRGRIINMSSIQAAIGMETYTPYTFTKAAVSGVTRVWALELAAYSITVNALCPGWTDTEMTNTKLVQRLARLHELEHEGALELIHSYVPQRRFIRVEEIAFAALFLASTLGAAVNGNELFLDGGMSHCAKAGLSRKVPDTR